MDAVLLGEFRRGDPEALDLVYRQNIDRVERLVRKGLLRLARVSGADLADVVQEVFLKAFSRAARASYDGHRAYRPYLLAIARNVLIDWVGRRGREIPTAEFVDLAVDELDAAERMAETSGATSGSSSEMRALVARYVEALPAELRAVHHQRFVLAESQRRAAESLGLSRQELRTLEQKIMDGLRRALRASEAPLTSPRRGHHAR